MPYPCFISYRHYNEQKANDFISQFIECLNSHLVPLCGESYIDLKRMQPGYDLPSTLAGAICNSACMVVIWTPSYINEEHIWCAKEYNAMMQLEAERLNKLGGSQKNKRLIIPVIYSGKNYYPSNLSEGTLYYDFSDFSLWQRKMIKNKKYDEQIKQLANYIFERLQLLKNANSGNWFECNGVNFPSNEETKIFIKQFQEDASKKDPFPFRN